MRDSKGKLICVASIKELDIQTLETIECLAIHLGLQLCLPLGIRNLIIESDCQLVVREIQSLDSLHSLLGNFYLDIRDLMHYFQFL